VKYLSEVNIQVQQAQKVTEGFVEEVVSVNELLAESLKQKKREVRYLRKDKKLRKSESCSFLDHFKYNKLSETQNTHPNAIFSMNKHGIINSQDTSCDSKEDKNGRQSRFFHDKHFSFKKRACSTAMSNFNVLTFDGEINQIKPKENQTIEMPKSTSTKISKKKRKNSLGKF